jgi:hypothetical protein
MPQEKIGDEIVTFTAPHPARTDSPEYVKSREWLMKQTSGGCYICGGPVDLSHPGAAGDPKGLEDHHGGGIYKSSVLVAFNLFPLEWSMGFGADPKKVAAFVEQLNAAGLCNYTKPIVTTQDVMDWVDSTFNANVKLCKLCGAPHNLHYPERGFIQSQRSMS